MVVISTALVLAGEGAAAEASSTSPFVFGAFAFIALSALLIATMMIKVGRD
jgi:hypothetical protein